MNEIEIKETIKKPSVKANYFFNLAYQIFVLIVPLITTPYVSRVLGAEGIGQYSFSVSLITFFTIFATLGFNYYSQREVAKYQDNRIAQTKILWEIFICRLIPVSIAMALNLILCLANVYKEYNVFMYILTINIVNVAFDINFFYQGNERFKSIVLRNFIVKIIAIASIFIFVKNSEDLWIYVLINALALLLANVSMWVSLNRFIERVSIKELRPFSHMKGALLLFLPAIAATIYTILDKALIGLLIQETYEVIGDEGQIVIKNYSDLENGYYEQAEKIVKMLLTIITAIGIVMVPRNSNEIATGNIEGVKENIYKTSRIVFFVGLPLAAGVASVANIFVPWFFGDGYEKCILLIRVLSPLIVIIGLSNVFGLQYLIPAGKDKQFTLALVIGSIVNVFLNIILIRFYWSVGAAIATIIAETIVTVVMAFMIRKEINILKIITSGWKSFVSAMIMLVGLLIIPNLFSAYIFNLLFKVGLGIIIYILCIIALKEEIAISIIQKFKRINIKSK